MLLEDEQRYARDQIARQQQQQLRQFPYAQRTSAVAVPQQQGRGSSPQSPPSQRERDTMADVQDQFTKLAESEAPSLLSSFLLIFARRFFGAMMVVGCSGVRDSGARMHSPHVAYRNDTDADAQNSRETNI